VNRVSAPSFFVFVFVFVGENGLGKDRGLSLDNLLLG